MEYKIIKLKLIITKHPIKKYKYTDLAFIEVPGATQRIKNVSIVSLNYIKEHRQKPYSSNYVRN